MSPEISKEFYELVNDSADACGVFYGPCRAAGKIMSYTEGSVDLLSQKDRNKLISTAAGDASANILTTTIDTASKMPGTTRLPSKFVDGLAHVLSTATGKILEVPDQK